MVWIGQFATLYYFVHFLVILPLLGKFERPRPLPTSIDKPVLDARPRRAAGGVSLDAPAHLRLIAAVVALRAGVPGRTSAAGRRRPYRAEARRMADFDGIFGTLRPRRRPARLPGLSRGLRGLPRPEVRRLPQPRRRWATRKTTSRRSRPSPPVTDGPNDEGEMFERPGQPFDRVAQPVPERAGGGVRPMAAGAARPVADRQGPRGRRGLPLRLLTGYEEPPGRGRGARRAATTTPTSRAM